MKCLKYKNDVTLSAISSMIAHSPIVVARPIRPLALLPDGFECADIIILDWIVSAGVAHRPWYFAN
jgi:hypothetical protein